MMEKGIIRIINNEVVFEYYELEKPKEPTFLDKVKRVKGGIQPSKDPEENRLIVEKYLYLEYSR